MCKGKHASLYTDARISFYPKEKACLIGIWHAFCYILSDFLLFMLRAVTGLANVKFRVDRIEVFAVEMLLYDSQTFTKTLIMHDLTFSKEADRITYFRIFHKPQDIIISGPGSFRSHIFMKICNRISFGLKIGCRPRCTAGSLCLEGKRMVNIIFIKTVFFDFFRCQIAC